MESRDEGALETVGWGPFALRGERKRLREAEARRLEEVKAASVAPVPEDEPPPEPKPVPTGTTVDAVKAEVAGPAGGAGTLLQVMQAKRSVPHADPGAIGRKWRRNAVVDDEFKDAVHRHLYDALLKRDWLHDPYGIVTPLPFPDGYSAQMLYPC